MKISNNLFFGPIDNLNSNNFFQILIIRLIFHSDPLLKDNNLTNLTFIGLGLHDERSISLQGLEEAKKATYVFAEFYTSYMPAIKISNLERLIGKQVKILSRKEVEENAQEKILVYAKKCPCVFLTPGDPNIATTHVDLRLRAENEGIRTSIIHSASIYSAISGATGLQNYKFGRTITIPFKSTSISEIPYENIYENKSRGLHTLALLDINSESHLYMSITEGLARLIEIEEKRRKKCATKNMLAIGAARLGSPDAIVKADTIENLQRYNWGGPPHCIVFPGKLHFMEIEALKILCKANQELFET
ncbi:diphthine synthase [[Eubacterium] cellulosolvens]